MQDEGDQDDLKSLFAKVADDKQAQHSDPDDAGSGRQSLAGFIAETSDSVDMSKLVNDHPWLLEVSKWPQVTTSTGKPGDDADYTDGTSIHVGVHLKPDSNETEEPHASIESEQAVDGSSHKDVVKLLPESSDARIAGSESTSTTSSKVKSHQRLPWVFCIVGMLFTVAMFMIVAFYVRDRAYKIINEDKQLILCQNQNFAQFVTEWIMQDLIDTVQRNWKLVQSGAAMADFSGTTISGTLPAVFMGLTASGTPPPPTPQALYQSVIILAAGLKSVVSVSCNLCRRALHGLYRRHIWSLESDTSHVSGAPL